MKLPDFSMRTSLALTMIVMGVLGMLLATVTGEVFREVALDNRRESIAELVELKSHDLLLDLERTSRDLSMFIQQDPSFRRSFVTRDVPELSRLLESQFHQYYVTAGLINLRQLILFDTDFSLIATSHDPLERGPCPQLVADARARTGPVRLRMLTGLCTSAGQPYFQALFPIGGLHLSGYLLVAANPAPNLLEIEKALDMPIRLSLPAGNVLHRSPTWPPPDAMSGTSVAQYILSSEEGSPVLNIEVLEDVKQLHRKLANTRHTILLVAGLVTVIAAMVALLMLERTVLGPLSVLRYQLRRIREDRRKLGQPLTVRGNTEITQLSQDFNALSRELKELYEQLEHMAYTDELTELPNRAQFRAYLDAGARPARGDVTAFALLVMDLDRFKEVNDTLGHDVGDELLRQVSVRLRGALRGSDIITRLDRSSTDLDADVVARLGGDEFAAILPNVATARDAAAIAQKLIQALDLPFNINGRSFNVGMSIGIALYPEHGEDQSRLLRQADAAMYEAKRSRRGYAIADIEQEQAHRLQFDFERELRAAIMEDGLELHYQPKIDLETDEVKGAEALVRWRRAGELVSPDQFIPIAETTGLIKQITLWVLDRALADCAQWRRQGYDFGVAVNLSAVNLHDAHIVEEVRVALAKSGLPPRYLSLEITESAVMSDPTLALDVAARLDAMGVHLAIDDFGTGYSSLTYLKQLPVDEIKIDKSFVLDMKQDNNDALIVRSTIDLAHTMGLQVVGEGVENENLLQLLKSLGCDLAQGYHISHPLPLASFLAWLEMSGRQAALSC